MIQLSFDQLLDRVESKYELAVAAAKRARALTESGITDENLQSEKPVTIALHEIAEGQLELERPQQQKMIK
ncbi:MAG: DNA-directed RNA polymerase subunit omega [Syntrophaceticus sp.]|nr:DNA-directed RNA polymerase subunit omega [Syntrophaceticus sp.]HBG21948.1 DNA-directed RNA polymerase subunit omega [Peptococcaceae bacterium]MDD3314861.1 DNA-directed RNA polymerase subunit omega [Syntrophaceticus sp.]MDD4360101.1 DNA-directed RNA polymerase subunit omega [Syntrophaceticus sp.]MDD4783007.1 DNA-directed RNA polymerase subunit omega [Syntrophaceticus sp.]